MMVQAYIDIFGKLHLQLHVFDQEEVLIIKFNSGLLFTFHHECDMFKSTTLEKAFPHALAVERKVHPHSSSYQPHSDPPTTSSSTNTSHTLPQPCTPYTWCTFHNTSSHSSADCRALQNQHTNKSLLIEVDSLSSTYSSDLIWTTWTPRTVGCTMRSVALGFIPRTSKIHIQFCIR